MIRRWSLIVGIAGLIICVAGTIAAPREALAAWLVAWLGWGSIPIGALGLLMLVALIPGTWRTLYAQPLTIGASLMPLVLVGVLPLLLGVGLLYPWTQASVAASFTGFKAAWLSSGFFAIRNIVFLLVLSGFAWWLIKVSPSARGTIAAIGLLLYALIGSLIGVDFAETTEPHFHSSIYGLLALTGQWLAGISFAILLGLWGGKGRAPFAAAAVLATAILLWAYMHAMQYIVIWAADIPEEVRWYLERGRSGWLMLAWTVFALQGLVPFAAMLAPAVRNSCRAMAVLAAMTLVMRLAENAWLVLPGLTGLNWLVAPLILGASAAMLGFGTFAGTSRWWTEKWREPGWATDPRSVP